MQGSPISITPSAWEIGLPFDDFAAVFVNQARAVSAVISIVVTALLVWFTLREPPRGLAEGHVVTTDPPPIKAVMAHVWSTPALRHLLIGWTVANFSMNAVAHFVLPFYLRGFGLPLAVVGAVFGLVASTSNAVGMLVGGFGFDRLSRRDPRWPLWGPAAGLVLAQLSRSQKPFSEHLRDLRRYATTGEVNFEIEDKDGTIERIASTFADARQDRLDGITVEYPDWWCNVRKSNTEPLLRLVMEADDEPTFAAAKAKLLAILGTPSEH